MDKLEFPNQIYEIRVMPRFVGDLEYRQRINWNSPNHEIRERANLMFSRMRNELYLLANGKAINLNYIGGVDYEYTFTDGFATLKIKALKDVNGQLCYLIEEVEWKFKNLDWWNIIENKQKHKVIINESKLYSLISESIKRILNIS